MHIIIMGLNLAVYLIVYKLHVTIICLLYASGTPPERLQLANIECHWNLLHFNHLCHSVWAGMNIRANCRVITTTNTTRTTHVSCRSVLVVKGTCKIRCAYTPKQGKGDLQLAGSSRTHFLRGMSLISISSTSPRTW